MTNDQVRLEMAHELHTAVFGDSWARPESPKQVWEMLLEHVREDSTRRPREVAKRIAELVRLRHADATLRKLVYGRDIDIDKGSNEVLIDGWAVALDAGELEYLRSLGEEGT